MGPILRRKGLDFYKVLGRIGGNYCFYTYLKDSVPRIGRIPHVGHPCSLLVDGDLGEFKVSKLGSLGPGVRPHVHIKTPDVCLGSTRISGLTARNVKPAADVSIVNGSACERQVAWDSRQKTGKSVALGPPQQPRLKQSSTPPELVSTDSQFPTFNGTPELTPTEKNSSGLDAAEPQRTSVGIQNNDDLSVVTWAYIPVINACTENIDVQIARNKERWASTSGQAYLMAAENRKVHEIVDLVSDFTSRNSRELLKKASFSTKNYLRKRFSFEGTRRCIHSLYFILRRQKGGAGTFDFNIQRTPLGISFAVHLGKMKENAFAIVDDAKVFGTRKKRRLKQEIEKILDGALESATNIDGVSAHLATSSIYSDLYEGLSKYDTRSGNTPGAIDNANKTRKRVESFLEFLMQDTHASVPKHLEPLAQDMRGLLTRNGTEFSQGDSIEDFFADVSQKINEYSGNIVDFAQRLDTTSGSQVPSDNESVWDMRQRIEVIVNQQYFENTCQLSEKCHEFVSLLNQNGIASNLKNTDTVSATSERVARNIVASCISAANTYSFATIPTPLMHLAKTVSGLLGTVAYVIFFVSVFTYLAQGVLNTLRCLRIHNTSKGLKRGFEDVKKNVELSETETSELDSQASILKKRQGFLKKMRAITFSMDYANAAACLIFGIAGVLCIVLAIATLSTAGLAILVVGTLVTAAFVALGAAVSTYKLTVWLHRSRKIRLLKGVIEGNGRAVAKYKAKNPELEGKSMTNEELASHAAVRLAATSWKCSLYVLQRRLATETFCIPTNSPQFKKLPSYLLLSHIAGHNAIVSIASAPSAKGVEMLHALMEGTSIPKDLLAAV